MNKNQRTLFKALEALSCAIMTMEDAVNITEKLTKEEIQEVAEKFSEKITEFDIDELYRDSYKYDPCANSILSIISSKLKEE